eukprot:gene1292-2497_t
METQPMESLAERERRIHYERLMNIKPQIDTSAPFTLPKRSPRGIARKQPTTPLEILSADVVKRDNYHLARRIYEIMQGPGVITSNDNSAAITNHPGTINFRYRLAQARKIHEENLAMAARLENIKPQIMKNDAIIVKPNNKGGELPRKDKSKKVKQRRPLSEGIPEQNEFYADKKQYNNQYRNDYDHDIKGNISPKKNQDHHRIHTLANPNNISPIRYTNTNDSSSPRTTHIENNQSNHEQNHKLQIKLPHNKKLFSIKEIRKTKIRERKERNLALIHKDRPQHVLLEYTKLQHGRIIDIAVMKEPFKDRYAILGIDTEDNNNNQRYELHLTSEEVSNILEGDILVTNIEHVEVWMALLHKIDLIPVDKFSKCEDVQFDINLFYQNGFNRFPNAPTGPPPSIRSSRSGSAGRNRSIPVKFVPDLPAYDLDEEETVNQDDGHDDEHCCHHDGHADRDEQQQEQEEELEEEGTDVDFDMKFYSGDGDGDIVQGGQGQGPGPVNERIVQRQRPSTSSVCSQSQSQGEHSSDGSEGIGVGGGGGRGDGDVFDGTSTESCDEATISIPPPCVSLSTSRSS